MKLTTQFIIFVLLFWCKINAQMPGVSMFYEQFSGDTRNYINGNLPIIISASHTGVKHPGYTIGETSYPDNNPTLQDRSCGDNEHDDNTDIFIREI